MIDAAVRTKLLATSGVTALVSTRIYTDTLPQTPTLPAITTHPASRIPSRTVGKGWDARVQVSCWSDPPLSEGLRSPAEVESVAAAVIAALHKPLMNNLVQRWTVGSVSFDVVTAVVTGGTRVIEDPTGWYHLPVDVQISYREV